MKITYTVNGKKKTIERNKYFRPDRLFATLAVLHNETSFTARNMRPEPFWDDLEKKGRCYIGFFDKEIVMISIDLTKEEEKIKGATKTNEFCHKYEIKQKKRTTPPVGSTQYNIL